MKSILSGVLTCENLSGREIGRRYVEQEATYELDCIQGHDLAVAC